MQSSVSPEDVQADRDAWAAAVDLLVAAGASDQAARRNFGKLLSQYKLKARDMRPAIRSAVAIGTQDPLPYLLAAAKSTASATKDPGLKVSWT